LGWEAYFLISMLAAAPGLLLLLRYERWTVPSLKPSVDGR
jgi:hypothetical protein